MEGSRPSVENVSVEILAKIKCFWDVLLITVLCLSVVTNRQDHPVLPLILLVTLAVLLVEHRLHLLARVPLDPLTIKGILSSWLDLAINEGTGKASHQLLSFFVGLGLAYVVILVSTLETCYVGVGWQDGIFRVSVEHGLNGGDVGRQVSLPLAAQCSSYLSAA